MDEILTNIRTKYNTLSKTQKVIADFILKNATRIPMFSITELAKACNTSETTVMRFLKKLNYNSYQVFRVKIAQATTKEPSTSINDDLDPHDDPETIKQKIIAEIALFILHHNVIFTAFNTVLVDNKLHFFELRRL